MIETLPAPIARYCRAAMRYQAAVSAIIVLLALTFSFSTGLVPFAGTDTGIYASVGERLLAGDRLYVDVYDNKGPVIYWLMALKRAMGGVTQYLNQLLMVAGSGVAVVVIARRFTPVYILPATLLALAGMYLFTCRFYYPGFDGTYGVFLTMLLGWLAIEGRFFSAGVVTGVLFFTSVTFMPVAVAFLGTFAVFRDGMRDGLLSSLRAAAGAGLALLAIFAVLAIRGEFSGYTETLVRNVLYSQENAMIPSGPLANVLDHAEAALSFGWRPMVAAVILGFVLWSCARGSAEHPLFAAACKTVALMIPVAFVTLSLVTIWPEHVLVLKPVLLLALALLAADLLARRPSGRKLAAIAVAGLLLVQPDARAYVRNPLLFPREIAALDEIAPETKLLRQMAGDRPASYARLGGNKDFHHASGTKGYRLACPEINLYRFLPPERLQGAVDCARTADFVIVNLAEAPWSPAADWLPPNTAYAELNRRWEVFLAQVGLLLESGYECRETTSADIDHSVIRVCRRVRQAKQA